MELKILLEQKREIILCKWIDSVLRTYPANSSEFLAKQKDRFHNPVGYTIKEALELIYGQIMTDMDQARLIDALDGVIRIRAVQDFTPSQAVAFLFHLKTVVRDVLSDQTGRNQSFDGLSEIDSRIDQVSSSSFACPPALKISAVR